MDDEKRDKLRIVIAGARGVGKSSLAARWLEGEVPASSAPSTSAQTYETTVRVDGSEWELELVDLPGPQEAELEQANADAFAVMYAITDGESYDELPGVLARLPLGKAPCLIIGNKADEVESDIGRRRRVVASDMGAEYARARAAMFIELSAADGPAAALKAALEMLVRRYRDLEADKQRRRIMHEKNESSSGSGSRGGRTRRHSRKGSTSLAMNRATTMSHGGLGRDPKELDDNHSSGCRCIIA